VILPIRWCLSLCKQHQSSNPRSSDYIQRPQHETAPHPRDGTWVHTITSCQLTEVRNVTIAQALFRRLFPRQNSGFRASYEGINPGPPLETAGISFQRDRSSSPVVVKDTQEVESFVDEFPASARHVSPRPFPLPGKPGREAVGLPSKTGAYGPWHRRRKASKAEGFLISDAMQDTTRSISAALGALETVGLGPHMFYFHRCS